MSHTATMDLKMVNKKAVLNTAKNLGLRTHVGVNKLFSTKEEGIGVYLEGWRYPIVIREDGTVAYDNYNGNWGKIEELEKFRNRYTREVAEITARKRGYKIQERKENGKTILKLTKFS